MVVAKIDDIYMPNVFRSYVATYTCFEFDNIEPQCYHGCYNGGRCSSPDVCTCARGWTGDTCSQGGKMCKRTYIIKSCL